MKSNLTEKLLSICGNTGKSYGCNNTEGITQLTEEQRDQVEAELIKHFEFDKIIWMELPAGLTEDKQKPIVAKSLRISDSDNPAYKHKVGYIYTLNFTPKMYDPMEVYQPVKDGCVFAPIIYDPVTLTPTQSITLTWSPERTLEDDKQMIRDMLEKVLTNPEEYRPEGFRGCMIRFAAL